MFTASARLKALLAGGAALAAFGLTAPAMAGGANDGCDPSDMHDYCPGDTTADNGGGNAKHDHAAGSKGKADMKNPPGQFKNGGDMPNVGYECDGNQGVGQGNPAHTGCDPYTDSDPDPEPDPDNSTDN